MFVISYIFKVATRSSAFILLNRVVLMKFLLLIKPLEMYDILPVESTPQKRKIVSPEEELDIQSVKKNFKNLNYK